MHTKTQIHRMTKSPPTDQFSKAAMSQRDKEARITSVDWDKAPISNATSRELLTIDHSTSMRPGAEDYRQRPSLIGKTRVPYMKGPDRE